MKTIYNCSLGVARCVDTQCAIFVVQQRCRSFGDSTYSDNLLSDWFSEGGDGWWSYWILAN